MHSFPDNDKELFRLISEGDEEAFEQLFHRYAPRLYPVMMKIIKSEGAVKDLIQETFLYLWMDRERLAGIGSPENWIFKIAYNRSYSHLAKHSNYKEHSSDLSNYEGHLSDNHLENSIALQEGNKFIREAINLLPKQAKIIFQLSREEGLKAGEIAAHLDISVQTVRNSLVRSTKFIRDYLAKHGIILPLLLITKLF